MTSAELRDIIDSRPFDSADQFLIVTLATECLAALERFDRAREFLGHGAGCHHARDVNRACSCGLARLL